MFLGLHIGKSKEWHFICWGDGSKRVNRTYNKKTVKMTKKNLFIKTYGCQMNVYDSDRMADTLAPHGYQLCDEPDNADMVILNTCHIRENASEKVFHALGRYKPMKQAREDQGKDMILAVAGCVGQAEGPEIIRRAPYVDIVLGPQTYHRLPEMIERAKRAKKKKMEEGGKKERIVETDFPVESKFDHLPAPKSNNRISAFLTIQEGCDKFCTFCCVPYTRGAEFSRSVAEVVAEAKKYVAEGIQEITLLGQNVNAYHGQGPNGSGEWGLGALCLELAELDGLKRIRYMTSHPRDVDDELIRAHGDCEKLMPFLHLPVQSGSDPILKQMNRKHTTERYMEIITDLRKARPDIAFCSDFIVGFPGENDRDFEATMELVRQVNYAQAFSFKYSPRPGTPAAAIELQVPESVKVERLKALQDLLNQQQIAFNQSLVGKTTPVLFERYGKEENQYLGKSAYMQSVHVICPRDIIGKLLDVEVTEAGSNSLKGRLK